jgi:hypothetical protein
MSTKIWLYVKKHTVTGLHYFGMSRKLTPRYLGSGKYWLRHIRKHGVEHVITTDVWEFESQEEATAFAIKFSTDNAVATSDKWANLREENALDGNIAGEELSAKCRSLWEQDYYREALSKGTSTESFKALKSAQSKSLWESPEYVSKQSSAHTAAVSNDDYRQWHSDHKKQLWQDPNYRSKVLAARETSITSEYRDAAGQRAKDRWEDPAYKAKLQQAHAGKRWYNNTALEKKCKEPPEGWVLGRLKRVQ